MNKKKITAGQKIIAIFHHLHSQILLKKVVFWEFSSGYQHLKSTGKFRNPPILHPGGLCKWSKQTFPKT